MATNSPKDSQQFAIFHLFEAISLVIVYTFFYFKLGILAETASKNCLLEKKRKFYLGVSEKSQSREKSIDNLRYTKFYDISPTETRGK